MALFWRTVRQSQAPAQPVAQVLVREVHTTLFQLVAYVGVFGLLGLAAMEFVQGPYLDQAADRLLAATAYKPQSAWISAARAPKLRGAD